MNTAASFTKTPLIEAALAEIKQNAASLSKEYSKKIQEILEVKKETSAVSLSEMIVVANVLKHLAKQPSLNIKSPIYVHLLLEGSEFIPYAPEKKLPVYLHENISLVLQLNEFASFSIE